MDEETEEAEKKTRTELADLEISYMNGTRQIKEDGLKAKALPDYFGTRPWKLARYQKPGKRTT